MTREEFGEGLLRHGADLSRWPRAQADDAKRLIASDPAAAKMLMDFSAFERTLGDAVKPPPFGAREIGMVLAERDHEERRFWPAPHFLLAGVSASALCFALGFAVMLALGPQPDMPDALVGLAIGPDDIGGLL